MIFQVYEAEFISFLLKYYQNNHKHFLIISKNLPYDHCLIYICTFNLQNP